MLVYHLALLICAAVGLSLQTYCMSSVSNIYCYMGISKMLEFEL